MKRFSLLTATLALALIFAATAMAAPAAQGTKASHGLKAAQGTKAKVATFDFLIDQSGSMMMTHKALKDVKFDLAKNILTKVNQKIPELDYAGSIHYFAPNKEVLRQSPYDKGTFGKSIASMRSSADIFGKMTPMGNNIQSWGKKLYNDLADPAAVIIVSDGESNRGMDPLAAAQEVLQANPGLCFHVISLADSKEGQTTLDAITALRPECSVSVKAADLLNSEAAVDQFVYEVFLGRGLVLRSIQFAFNSSTLTHESTPILNELAKIAGNSRMEISGHTCNIGTDEYNQRLSERRAAAVKAYLVKKGIPASKITTRGYGKTRPKFDNSTEEGRRLNRRAEIDFR